MTSYPHHCRVSVCLPAYANVSQKKRGRPEKYPLLLDMLLKRDAEMQFLVFTCRPGDYLTYLSRIQEKYLRSINLEEVMKPG